eukprot:scaffold102061_cov26-Tisochrysis_lutea.AAC.1
MKVLLEGRRRRGRRGRRRTLLFYGLSREHPLVVSSGVEYWAPPAAVPREREEREQESVARSAVPR